MPKHSDEAQIRALIKKWASSVRTKDMDGVLANHAVDIVMFDVPMPLQSKGLKEYRKTGNCSLITVLEGLGRST
jgi:ketosteroid isomerase-like protein